MEPKVVIVTGASRGIGLAIAHDLLAANHKVVLVSRSAEQLQKLKEQFPSQVAYLAADMTVADTAFKVTELAVLTFGRIDGVIINHGVLFPMTRIADSSVEEWKKLYDANFFSALALSKETIPHLRASKGRVIFTSSGAARGAYTAWGAYGSSKAAMNSLAQHIAVEEPEITSVAISPGRVDTNMQKEIREQGTAMAKAQHDTFLANFEEGTLVKPEQAGGVIAKLSVRATPELSGKFLEWNATELAEYQ